jgi:uncharacterized membrane protein
MAIFEAMKRLLKLSFRILPWVYGAAWIIASFHQYLMDKFNNYKIFRASFGHLLHGRNLYQLYPKEQWDLFKYSPAFALFMAPFSILPFWLGLLLWNGLNVGIFWLGIHRLPLAREKKNWIAAICFLEMLTSVQNSQSNALLAGLMLLAIAAMETGRSAKAAFFSQAGLFIKLFGLLICFPMLLYKSRFKTMGYSIIAFIILLLIPLLVTPPHMLLEQYKNWWVMLTWDHGDQDGLSFMHLIQSWAGIKINFSLFQLCGLMVLLLPLLRFRQYGAVGFRLRFLAAVLIWSVIFNHKAESPTFVIAVAGAAIWFVLNSHGAWRTALLVMLMLLTSLSPTDLFPRFIREHYIIPLVLKALPCVLIWFVLMYELMFLDHAKMQSLPEDATVPVGGRKRKPVYEA